MLPKRTENYKTKLGIIDMSFFPFRNLLTRLILDKNQRIPICYIIAPVKRGRFAPGRLNKLGGLSVLTFALALLCRLGSDLIIGTLVKGSYFVALFVALGSVLTGQGESVLGSCLTEKVLSGWGSVLTVVGAGRGSASADCWTTSSGIYKQFINKRSRQRNS